MRFRIPLLAAALFACGSEPETPRVDIHILSIADWGAQLDPLSSDGSPTAAGASALASHFKRAREGSEHSLTVATGNSFGASPPLSALFDDEPAVRAMELMGIEVDTFGNNNFNGGVDHLQEMIDLAKTKFVASNLDNLEGNLQNIASPYLIVEKGGVKIALIGVVTPNAASITIPGALGTLNVTTPAAAATLALESARSEGASVFVALVQLGVVSGTRPETFAGPLIDFARAVDGFHLILGGDTDHEAVTAINGAMVVQNRSKGRTFAKVRLRIEDAVVVQTVAELIVPYVAAVEVDPGIEALLQPFRDGVRVALDRPAGVAAEQFGIGGDDEVLRELEIGNLVTDAMRNKYATDLALMNTGAIRAPIPSGYLPTNLDLRRASTGYRSGPPYDVVVGDAYAALPYENFVVTRTITGAQLWAMLENSVGMLPVPNLRFAQISGFGFDYQPGAPAGMRVRAVRSEAGAAIAADDTEYTLATLDFINLGGDGYSVLADGEGETRELLPLIVAEYIEGEGTITPRVHGRITAVP